MPMISTEGPQYKERSGSESTESSPGRFVAHTERISKMKKSSRFWWLQGAILLSAVIGCKNSGGGGYGPSTNPPPYGTVSSGPISSSGATMYSSPTPYSSGTTMPSNSSSFSSPSSTSYPVPNMASSMPQ